MIIPHVVDRVIVKTGGSMLARAVCFDHTSCEGESPAPRPHPSPAFRFLRNAYLQFAIGDELRVEALVSLARSSPLNTGLSFRAVHWMPLNSAPVPLSEERGFLSCERPQYLLALGAMPQVLAGVLPKAPARGGKPAAPPSFGLRHFIGLPVLLGNSPLSRGAT